MTNPKLRPVEAFPVETEGRRLVCLRDPSGIAENTLAVSPETFFLLTLFDGNHSLLDIQAAYARKFGDLLFTNKLRELIEQLDSNFFLETERFERRRRAVMEEFAQRKTRPASHAGGAYEAEPAKLRAQLDSFFMAEGGPGAIVHSPKPAKSVRAIVAPHIDFLRGGVSFAWAYKALAESCDAERFVILGIAHNGLKNLFALTKKAFETPLGLMPTDNEMVERINSLCSVDLLEDEFAHRNEHSVEFQAVFLRHVLPKESEAKIVPVLCSSLVEAVEEGRSPMDEPRVAEFVEALRRTIEECGKKVCIIAGADLSHVGRRFGDEVRMSEGLLGMIESKDRQILARAEAMDAEGFFQAARRENPHLHICGYPAIYVLLRATEAKEGRLLRYDQAVDWQGHSVVTFASMAFS